MKKIRFWAISVAILLLKEPHIHHHEFSVRILTEKNKLGITTVSAAIDALASIISGQKYMPYLLFMTTYEY